MAIPRLKLRFLSLAWRFAKRRARLLRWRSELNRIRALRSVGQNRRAFLVGNGPSLREMNLSPLEGEFVCLVNTGLRALGAGLLHADMHVVNDIHCYRNFGREIEEIARLCPVPYRFLNLRMKRQWRAHGKTAGPIFLINNEMKIAESEPVPDLTDGVVTGPSVLLSAAVLLDHMGFGAIYVIGCDLDYETAGAYFYAMNDADLVHENDPDVMARRRNMVDVNAQFAVLRADFERRGRRIFNAGNGGNLESLPRVDFASLFSGPVRPSSRDLHELQPGPARPNAAVPP